MADPSTGNEVNQFPNAPPKYYDNGSGAKLLQPANQVPYLAPGNAFSQTDMQKLRDALIVAGIMQPS